MPKIQRQILTKAIVRSEHFIPFPLINSLVWNLKNYNFWLLIGVRFENPKVTRFVKPEREAVKVKEWLIDSDNRKKIFDCWIWIYFEKHRKRTQKKKKRLVDGKAIFAFFLFYRIPLKNYLVLFRRANYFNLIVYFMHLMSD